MVEAKYHANTNQKKPRVAVILVSGRVEQTSK